MSYLIKSQVFFNNSWHEIKDFTYGKGFYPVKVSEKLSKELDSGELQFYTDTDLLYPQMTKFLIEIDTRTVRARRFYFYGTDVYDKLNPNLFKHRVALVEPTKDLEGVILDGLGFAQPKDNSKRMTLYDITQRLLACTPFRRIGESQKYTLTNESNIVEILQAQTVDDKLLPEFFWSSQTNLKEALCDIGAYCNLYPRLTLNPNTNEYTIVTFDEVNKIKEILESIDYLAYQNTQDDEQYCSELETNAQNMISKSEDLNTIVYPSPTGWVTPRTDEVRLTTDNAIITLPFSINKMIKVLLPAEYIGVLQYDSEGNKLGAWVSFSKVYDLQNQKVDSFDVSELVYEKTGYDTLPVTHMGDVTKDTKNNTIYYSKGDKIINLGGNIKNFIGFQEFNIYGLIKRIVKKLNEDHSKYYGYHYYEEEYPMENQKQIIDQYTEFDVLNFPDSDPRKVKFRIEYEPLNTSSKFRISKSLSVNKPFIQNYNQRAEINSAEALGRNMRGTVNRMGVPAENKLQIKPDLSEVPHVGDAQEKDGKTYIISQIDYNCFSMYEMAVNLTLSQDWNMLSQYVGIDRQFRWEQIYSKPVERNLFYHDYLVVLPYHSENEGERIYLADISKATDVLKCEYAKKTEVNNCYFGLTDHEVIISVSSIAVGSSMLFTAKTQDNLSAGKSMQDSQYCIDTYYCNDDGTISTLNIFLATDIKSETLDPDKLPVSNFSTLNAPEGIVASDTFEVDKNSSEQLNFVYEISWVSPCPYLVIGENLAMNNPMVRQWNENRKFKYIRLKKPLPQGTVKVTSGYIKSTVSVADDSGYLIYIYRESAKPYQTNISIMDGNADLEGDPEVVGWAITDENYGLLIACNKKTERNFKIVSSHEYHGKKWNI